MLNKAIESRLNLLKIKAAEILLKQSPINIHKNTVEYDVSTSDNFAKKQEDLSFEENSSLF